MKASPTRSTHGPLCAAIAASLLTAACNALPPDVAQPVRQSLAAMDNGDRPLVSPRRLAAKVRVSPSGDDWLINYEKTGDFGWCGTGGCTRELYVARDGGHVLVFSEQVVDWRLTPGSPAVLDLNIHGSNCDLPGGSDCLRRFLWNEATGRFDEAVNREGSGDLIGPLFQPIGPDPASYPDVVTAEIARRESLCHAAGGRLDAGEYPAVSSPDLNGDGKRDWILGSKYTQCHADTGETDAMPKAGLSVVTSHGDTWTIALRTDETDYVVDVARLPARFGLRNGPQCTGRPACPTRYFAWRDSTQTLEKDANPR